MQKIQMVSRVHIFERGINSYKSHVSPLLLETFKKKLYKATEYNLRNS